MPSQLAGANQYQWECQPRLDYVPTGSKHIYLAIRLRSHSDVEGNSAGRCLAEPGFGDARPGGEWGAGAAARAVGGHGRGNLGRECGGGSGEKDGQEFHLDSSMIRVDWYEDVFIHVVPASSEWHQLAVVS